MVELAHTYPMPRHVTLLRFCSSFLMRTAIVCAVLSLLLLPFMILIEENAVELPPGVGAGLDDFGRMAMGVVALGGGFGVAIVFAIVRDVYRRLQRRALDRIVTNADSVPLQGLPVEWQRSALGNSRAGAMILAAFGVVLGPIIIITAVWMLIADGSDSFLWGTLAVGAVMTFVGVLVARSTFTAEPSAAEQHWGERKPPLHPREPPRRYDSDGDPMPIGKRELATHARAQREVEQAPKALRDLARIDGIAGRVMTGSLALFILAGLAVAGLVMLRQPCRDCDQRFFDEPVERFIDGALIAAAVAVAVGLALLVLATVVESIVTLRLRRTIIEAAHDPASTPPPWFLLRRLLLEESPLADLTGHLHSIGVTCLAIGLTGWMTRAVFPMSEWEPWFQPLMALGGVLLLFHASAWFWHREQTRMENHALMERWPD